MRYRRIVGVVAAGILAGSLVVGSVFMGNVQAAQGSRTNLFDNIQTGPNHSIFDYREEDKELVTDGEKALVLFSDGSALPAKVDLREIGHITPVRDQMYWGTCWTFALAAASESSLINDGLLAGCEVIAPFADTKAAEMPTYSDSWLAPKHFAYFARTPLAEPIWDEPHSQLGEGTIVVGEQDTYEINGKTYLYGGNEEFEGYKVYANGIGPHYESEYPYVNAMGEPVCDGDWNLDQGERFAEGDFTLVEGRNLPDFATFDDEGEYALDARALQRWKEEINAGRAISFGYSHDAPLYNVYSDEQTDLDGDEIGRYFFFSQDFWGANHSVCIVGYNDKVPKELFGGESPESQPEGDGAFLVKNSWSSLWGDDGYFWISYYDRTACCGSTYSFTENDGLDIQAYDYMNRAMNNTVDEEETISCANVFTAETDLRVKKVGFISANPETTATITIHRGGPEGEVLAQEVVECELGGYRKIDITDAPRIAAGEDYAVEVELETEDGWYFPLSVSAHNEEYQTNNAVVNPGESYYYSEGEWDDLYEMHEEWLQRGLEVDNMPIKAFTGEMYDQDPIDADTLTPVNETQAGNLDGKIEGTTGDYEYSIDGGENWQPCGDGETDGLGKGEVLVRKAETDTLNVSDPITVTIDADSDIFADYKESKKPNLRSLLKDGDSDACKKLVEAAEAEYEAIAYDPEESLAENEARIDAFVNEAPKKLAAQLAEQRAKEAEELRKAEEERKAEEQRKAEEAKKAEENERSKAAKTGDTANAAMYLLLMLGAAATLVIAGRRMVKR